MGEVEKMVNFRLRSIQVQIILLEQDQVQPCIFFWKKNKIFSHCSSEEEYTTRLLLKAKWFCFALSAIR